MDLGRTSMMSRALGVNAKSGSPKKLRESRRGKKMQARMHIVVALRICLAAFFILILVVVVPALVIRARSSTARVPDSFLNRQQRITQYQTFHSDLQPPVNNSSVLTSLGAEDGSTTTARQEDQAIHVNTDTHVVSDSLSTEKQELPPPDIISTLDPSIEQDSHLQSEQQHQEYDSVLPPVLRGNDRYSALELGYQSDAANSMQPDLQLPVITTDDQPTVLASGLPVLGFGDEDNTRTTGFLIPHGVPGEEVLQTVEVGNSSSSDAWVVDSTQVMEEPSIDAPGLGDLSASVLYDVPEEQEAADMVHDYMHAAHVFDDDMYATDAGQLDHQPAEDEEDTDSHDAHAFDAYSEELMNRGGHLEEPGKDSTHGSTTGETHTGTVDVVTGAEDKVGGSDTAVDVTGPSGVIDTNDTEHSTQQSFGGLQEATAVEEHTVDTTSESLVTEASENGHDPVLGGTDNDQQDTDEEDSEEEGDYGQSDGASAGMNVDDQLKAKVQEQMKQDLPTQMQEQQQGEHSIGNTNLSHGDDSNLYELRSDETEVPPDLQLRQADSAIMPTGSKSDGWKVQDRSVQYSRSEQQWNIDTSMGTGQEELALIQNSVAATGTADGDTDGLKDMISSLRGNLEEMNRKAAQQKETERKEELAKRDLFFEEVELYKSLPFYIRTPVSQLFTSTESKQQPAQDSNGKADRKPLSVFVGIFTAASSKAMYKDRRQAIRDTWLPALAALPDVEHAFVVGTPKDPNALDDIHLEEEEQGGPFLLLDAEDCYNCLPEKTLSFLLTVREHYDAKWVLKIDDDVFLSPARLLDVVQQWSAVGADYVGCMKTGGVHGNDNDKWYEPLWRLISEEYYMHAYGSAYAVSSQVVDDFVVPNHHLLRKTRNEDTTVGLWMLMFNTTFFEDLRMCQQVCSSSSLIVSEYKCTGLCNPTEDQRNLWFDPECSMTPALVASIEDETQGIDKVEDVVGPTHEDTLGVSDVKPPFGLPFVPPPDWWSSHTIFAAMSAAVEQ